VSTISHQLVGDINHKIRNQFMTHPLVSIVISSYNYAQYLPKTINSALGQTYTNIEVIVVDDGSVDNSPEIIISYGKEIIPILKENGGQGSALNIGFKACRGEIIIFVDSDDYLFPYAVEEVVSAWDSSVSKIQYRLELIDSEGKYLDTYPSKGISFNSPHEVLPILLKTGQYITPVTTGNAFSREFLDEIMPIPEADFITCPDGYLVILAPLYGEIISIDRCLGAYRKHGNNYHLRPFQSSQEKINTKGFRKVIDHCLTKYRYLRTHAEENGYRVSLDLGSGDYNYLLNRLASITIEPEKHPIPIDSRIGVTYQALSAMWVYSQFKLSKKLVCSCCLILVGLVNQAMAKNLILWFMFPNTRPKILVSFIKIMRDIISLPIFRHQQRKQLPPAEISATRPVIRN
jgi:glycosyltransferase involved in cell wall biosynthesis